jgi:hypothetical protein
MTIASRILAGAALLTVAATAAACGSNPEFAEQPFPDAGVDAAPPPPPPPPDAGPPAPVSGPCDPVQTLAMTTMFQGRAPGTAPQMQPDGAATCGIAPEGQVVLSQPFMLQPGHCYTFMAQGLPTVTEVDLRLIPDGGAALPPAVQALLSGAALAIDTDSGVEATIGAKQSCYQWAFPFPIAVKMEIKARTGSGPVAAQAYKRKK